MSAQQLPVTTDLDGSEIALTLHTLVGSGPGPRLLLTGVQHGDEWLAIELMRRVVADLEPRSFRGTLLVLPVCSPIALRDIVRITQPASDGPDLNRVYGGAHHWLPEQIARTIATQVLPNVDALIDFHFGIWGTGIGFVGYGIDFPDAHVVERGRQMALAFGHPLVHRGRMASHFPGPGSLVGYAGAQLGIPNMVAEIGVAGFGRAEEDRWLDVNLHGIRNVMRQLGMLDDAQLPPSTARTLLFDVNHRVEPTRGGLLLPVREPDELGRAVQRGDLLARVVSPYTFAELERLEAPTDGLLTLIARSYPVRPGDWAFGVADTNPATSEWLTT